MWVEVEVEDEAGAVDLCDVRSANLEVTVLCEGATDGVGLLLPPPVPVGLRLDLRLVVDAAVAAPRPAKLQVGLKPPSWLSDIVDTFSFKLVAFNEFVCRQRIARWKLYKGVHLP